MNEYKLLGTKSKQIVNALKIFRMPLFLRIFKEIKKRGQIEMWWHRKWINKVHKIEHIKNKIYGD